MKTLTTIILLLLATTFAESISASDLSTITGKVIDENNLPAEFTNVVLYQTANDSLYDFALTDSNGVFSFQNIVNGNYYLVYSFMAYQTDTIKNIVVDNQDLNLPQHQLTLLSNILDGVTIIATKPIIERKADRIIYNVENSVYAQGSDALQALSKAPRVQIQNNEIKMAGKGTVAVLINDRILHLSGEELAQYLKNIPSDDIQKIEVIPNPPAKYDAQGSALVNIVLKKNKKDGYNGSVTGSFIQAQYQGGSLGGTFNYTKNKISINTSLFDKYNKGYREETHILEYTDQTWKDTTINPSKNNAISSRLNINYQINNKQQLGINYNGNWNRMFWNKEKINTYVTNNYTKEILQSIINNANSKQSSHNHNAVLYYTCNIDTTGKKLDIGFDYFNSYSNRNRNYTNETYNDEGILISNPIPQENTLGIQKSNIYVFNADIEHPTKYGAWQYGIKLTHFSTNSNNEQSILQADNTTYLLDTTRSSVFNYKEYTEAIYGSFNKSFEKVELQLGMRLEFTQLKGTLINTNEVNKQQYVRPFPSVMIQYNINENHTINYSITSGIDRPSSWQLNPFRYYINNYTYAEGNPFILPDYGISTALDYTLNDSYMFSIYYNYNNNSIGQVSYVDSITNISHYRWEAGRKVHDVGFYNEYNFSIKDRWLPSISIDAYIDFLKSPFLHNATERKYWSLDLKISNDFIFDTKNRFSGNLNYYFRPNGIGQEELTMRAIHSLSFGLKAQLLKEKQLILSVNAENVLRNKPTNGYKRTPTGEYFSFTNYYDERFFRFTATYKFGNNQLKTKTKQINNEDINRVN